MDGFVAVEVVGVRVEMPSNSPIVVVRDEAGTAMLPIWIGPTEAAAIAMALQGVAAPRPLTHDLFVSTLAALGSPLRAVRITHLSDGVFHGELVMDRAVVDARPSDAIALALRSRVPILVATAVLEEAGIAPGDQDGAPREDAAEVERFRAFLDQVTPEDFTDASD